MKTKSTLTSWVVSKGAFCTIPRFYGRWKRLNRREEKAFCTFSQQLNNPHALRIDRLPREIERGWDGEKGRKRGRAWVFGSEGACCAWWYCGTFVCVCVCVCMGSVVSSLGPGQGPHSARSLWLSSLEGGHSWWGHDSLRPPRQSQHEQGLLNLAFSGPLALPFFTATLEAPEDPNMREEREGKQRYNHNRKNSRVCAKRKMEALLRFSSPYSSSGVISEVCLRI